MWTGPWNGVKRKEGPASCRYDMPDAPSGGTWGWRNIRGDADSLPAAVDESLDLVRAAYENIAIVGDERPAVFRPASIRPGPRRGGGPRSALLARSSRGRARRR